MKIILQDVAEKTTELEMELTTARKSLHKLQEEKDHLQEELQSAIENKTGVEESLNQLTEVKQSLISRWYIHTEWNRMRDGVREQMCCMTLWRSCITPEPGQG